MNNKVIWNKNYIIYKYSKREPYYLKDYFILKQNFKVNEIIQTKTKSITNIKVLNSDEIKIEGEFNIGDKLIVDGIEYIYEENKNEEETEENPIEKEDVINFGNLKIFNNENKIYVFSTCDEKIEIFINEYTSEIYPEFPYNNIKKIICISENKNFNIFDVKKGTIIIVKILKENNEYIEIEYENLPLYHFSTVKSLKEKILNLNLQVIEKEDEYYKKLITEKSIYLKKRFGLTEKELKNIELFPAFKELTNFYCIQSLISLTYIQGENINSSNQIGTRDMSLGKFKTDGDISNNSIFAPDAIKNLIKELENNLHLSIFNKSYTIKKDINFTNHFNEIQYNFLKVKVLKRGYANVIL